MPTTRAGKSAERHHGRSKKATGSAQLDIVAAYDTRYPDLRRKSAGRSHSGNGPRPANPFGGRIKAPNVG